MIWRHLVTISRDAMARGCSTDVDALVGKARLCPCNGNAAQPDSAAAAVPSTTPDRRRSHSMPVLVSVGDALPGRRREDMRLARPRHDVQPGALVRDLAAVDPYDQV